MKPIRVRTISEFHRLNELAPPAHPLISIVDYATVAARKQAAPQSVLMDYYTISKKRGLNGRMRYGQQDYDFNEGVMYFMAPGQILQTTPLSKGEEKPSGWILLIHPDFLWNTPLASSIHQYEYFDYEVNEALFLSEKEEVTIDGIIENIRSESHNNIDKFSQGIIISHIGTLLHYAERFYSRQFITRKKSGHQVFGKLDQLPNDSFHGENAAGKGLPTVKYLSEQMHMSPGYLSSLLKNLTGMSMQQHIHEKLIERAKERLSTTALAVSQIAYELGFEHSQSFSKLFKSKTSLSPLEFRASFN